MPIPDLPLFRHRDTVVTPADQNQFVTQFENTMDTMSNDVIPAMNTSINDMNTQYNNIYNNLPFAPDSGYSQAYIDNNFVKLTENQTIAGVKTFTSSPIVPTPTTDFQVATKKYVDDKTVASSEIVAGVIEIATTAEVRSGTDDLKAITPLKLKDSVLGLGQTWQNVTASRLSGSIYTNSTGKPIMVAVTKYDNPSSGSVIIGSIGGVSIVETRLQISNAGGNISFIVPANYTYSVAIIGGGTTLWQELR